MAEALSFNIFARDRGAARAFDKVSESVDAARESFAKFSAAAKVAGAAGVAAGVGLVGGLVKGMDVEKANDRLIAQLGAVGPQSQKLGAVAGHLYANAYGENIGQVNEALRSVVQNISGMSTASGRDLEKVSAKVLDLGTAFDQDVGQTSRAVGKLIKTGMAKDATSALDLLTRGFQTGANEADDLLDTVSEYSTMFREVGLTGETSFGLISQGLKAGARDADTVADAIKEFSVRAKDGSTATADGFRAIGLDAKKMAADIAGGGPKASKALDVTLDRLRAMKDPVARDAAAVALFGTKAEDLGDALFALDPSKAVTALGRVKGAADSMGKTLNENAATNLESFKRQATQAFVNIVGGKAVPMLTKLSSTLATNVGPVIGEVRGGIVAFTAAWKANDGDITSSGLPGFMEQLGFRARQVFDVFRNLGGALARDKDILIPLVAAVGGGILAFKLITGAIKAWTIAQGLLNLVLTANPIGLVIVGIAALAAGLVIAYRKSETFRTVVNSAFSVVKTAGSIMWTILKPLFRLFGQALQVIWGRAQTFGSITAAAFGAIKEPARTALKFVLDHFTGFIEGILTGAAKAFGWVPELGPKLKTAASDFAKFREDVNRKLDGIDDEVVNVAFGVSKGAPLGKNKLAGGGPVWGRGTSTSDSISALLSNNEHVITAKEVQGAGGHRAVEAMRAIWARGFARGGPVGLTPRVKIPGPAKLDPVLRGVTRIAGIELARLWSLGPAGPPGGVRGFRGHKLNSRTIGMLLAAERMLGSVFKIMQGSYSTRVAASGGTHAGGGALDTNGPRGWGTAVRALRGAGFAAWHRTPAQGPWGHHIHAIAIGDSTASLAARRQVRDYLRGGDGLGGGFAAGGPVKMFSFDQGGQWPSGTLGVNTSGRTETVFTGDQSALTAKAISAGVRDGVLEAFRRGVRIEQRGGSAYLMVAGNG